MTKRRKFNEKTDQFTPRDREIVEEKKSKDTRLVAAARQTQ